MLKNMKKRILLISVLAMSFVLSLNMSAQDKWKFTEASELTLVGKLFPDTPVPYHRLDTLVYHDGFTSSERHQVTMSSGVSVAFRTNSPKISVCPTYGRISGLGTTGAISQKGFDLYVKDGKEWKWAGSTTAGRSGENKLILNNNEKGMLECLLYLPLVSSVDALKIGVEDGYDIQPAENPFRHRIAIFGSSYTHGISTSRPGMAYPAQLSRMTGLQFLSLGCSGNSKLQDYFARALADADVDAYVFDAFSNPSPAMIKERLFKFIEIIQEKHPDTPLIFQKTIYRERRNYDAATDRSEAAKMEMAENMMRQACSMYKNVYYVETTNATAPDHETSVDGTHPGDYGYQLWAKSVAKPICKILAKYGIRCK